MKTKIILFIFILLIITLSFFINTTTLVNAIYINNDKEKEVIYALDSFKSDSYLECGNLKIIDKESVSNNLHMLSEKYLGESLVVFKMSAKEFINQNKLKIVSHNYVCGIPVYDCYLWCLPKFVWLKNQKVNLQIAEISNNIKVGYPLILDSF